MLLCKEHNWNPTNQLIKVRFIKKKKIIFNRFSDKHSNLEEIKSQAGRKGSNVCVYSNPKLMKAEICAGECRDRCFRANSHQQQLQHLAADPPSLPALLFPWMTSCSSKITESSGGDASIPLHKTPDRFSIDAIFISRCRVRGVRGVKSSRTCSPKTHLYVQRLTCCSDAHAGACMLLAGWCARLQCYLNWNKRSSLFGHTPCL